MPWKRAKRVRRVTLPWRLCRQMAWSFESWANFEQIRTHNAGSHSHGAVFWCNYLILFECKKVPLTLFHPTLRSMVGTILPELNPKQLAKLSSTTRYSDLQVAGKPGWLFIRRVHALLFQEVVLAAVQHTGMALFYASPALRDDNQAVLMLTWLA